VLELVHSSDLRDDQCFLCFVQLIGRQQCGEDLGELGGFIEAVLEGTAFEVFHVLEKDKSDLLEVGLEVVS